MEISKELIEKAKACKTEEELKALAENNGLELTDYEIKLILTENAEGELADDELEAVSGGQKGCKRNGYEDVYFDKKEDVQYIFKIGDVVEAFIGIHLGNETATVRITKREVHSRIGLLDSVSWFDVYDYERIEGSPTHWGMGWQQRSRFQK